MYQNEIDYADGLFYDSEFADTFDADSCEYFPETDRVHYFDPYGNVLVVDIESGDVYLLSVGPNGE